MKHNRMEVDMKKWWFAFLVALSAILLAGNCLSATYDITGAWDYTISNYWNNCEDPIPETSQGIDIFMQNGDNFTHISLDRGTFTGTVNGNVYTAPWTFYEDGGWVTATYSLIASSSTQLLGTGNWTWSGEGESCSGGFQYSLTKQQQIPPTYNATGTWDYSESGLWNNCGDPNPQPGSGTDTLTQTGNRITVVDDQQRSFDGFVSGSTYTFVRSYPEEDGITSEVYTVTLSSGGTSGSGTSKWVWNDAYDLCNGGWNFSYVKQQAEKVTAMPWIPLLLLDD
jgi:hypothetical protein